MKQPCGQSAPEAGDEGYLLLGLVVVCFLLVLALGVAAPRVAKQLERDREVESEHRAQQYVRAIQLYYRRTKRFPSSVEELLGGGSTGMSSALKVKYLRQQYADPLTGSDYRLILVGKAKTEVKGFFGEPLSGVPVGNLGSVAGMQSSAGVGSAPGQGSASASTGLSFGSSAGSPTSSQSSNSTMTFGGTLAGSSTTGTSGSSTDATSFQGSKGAFVGVASNAKGHGLVEWNGSENMEDWEFLYDPRVELLKAKVSIFGGSPAASGTGSFGGAIGSGSTSIFGPSTATNTTGSANSPGTSSPTQAQTPSQFGAPATP